MVSGGGVAGQTGQGSRTQTRQPALYPARSAGLQPLTMWGCMPGLSACKGDVDRRTASAQLSTSLLNQCQ